MLVVPNMQVEVTRGSIESVLLAGGCVGYLGTGNPRTVYAVGKPDHLAQMVQRKGVTVVGEIHKTPKLYGVTNELV